MDPLPPSRRLYGDKEISKILRRASELQRREPARPDPAGLTLAELEEVALEAGIDAENLRRAAMELDAGGGSGLEAAYLGAPLVLRLERVVPGELGVDALGTLVPMIQTSADVAGQASVVGRTLTWHSPGQTQHQRSLQILIMSKDGQTLIRIEERSTNLAVGLHVGIPVGGGVGMGLPAALGIGATVGVGLGLVVGVGAVAGTYWLAREIYRRLWRRRRRTLTDLLERLVAEIERAVVAPSLPGAAAQALPGSGEARPEPGGGRPQGLGQ